MHAARQTQADLFALRRDSGILMRLPQAAQLPGFRGTLDTVFTYGDELDITQPVYARVHVAGGEPDAVSFTGSTLDRTLARGAEHARMIALVFGALVALALSALLIWFVLVDRLFILYATLFFLQSLYIVFLSGQGFEWPWLSFAQPLTSFAWNVPVSLSGAVACLFTREIADLKHSSPRIYKDVRRIRVGVRRRHHRQPGQVMGLRPVGDGIGQSLVHRDVDIHRGGCIPCLAARQSCSRMVLDRLGIAGRLHDFCCGAISVRCLR